MARRSEVGKRVGGFLYLHQDALPLAGEEVREAVARAEGLSGGFEWNVAKVSPKRQSLLLYEDFSASAFPAPSATPAAPPPSPPSPSAMRRAR